MPFLVKIAARNIVRNPRRTLLTFGSLAVGIITLIIVDSLLGGFTSKSLQNIIDYETGDLKVHAVGYFSDRENLPLDRSIDPAVILPVALSVQGVESASPRTQFTGRVVAGWEEFPVLAIAVNSDRDGDVLRLADDVDGRLPRPGTNEAVIGANLSTLLGLEVGDVATIVTRTRDHAIQAMDLTIVGVASTPNPNVNRNHIYLAFDTTASALGMAGRATEIVVRLAPGVSAEAAKLRLERALTDSGVAAEVVTWKESAADFLALAQTGSATDLMLVAAIFLIAIVGVTNTTLLGALERKREIGTMQAMGLRQSEIVRLFLLESAGIGILATIAGSVLGAAVNVYLVEVGIDVSSMLGDIDLGFPIDNVIRGTWNPATYIWGAAAGFASCLVSSYIPARQAARQHPAVMMRQ